MLIAFIGRERTELGVKKEGLESVALMTEDRQQMSVQKKRSKH
jgi:hypothetical protein